jgi:hypothetical protein
VAGVSENGMRIGGGAVACGAGNGSPVAALAAWRTMID